MPQIKSAKKRMKTSVKSREWNRVLRSRIATAKKALLLAVAGTNADEKHKALQTYFSVLDKAAKTNAIKKNTANRSKSRAAKLLKRTS